MVYAVALVLIVRWLPLPEESASEGAVRLLDLFAEHAANIVAVLFLIMDVNRPQRGTFTVGVETLERAQAGIQ